MHGEGWNSRFLFVLHMYWIDRSVLRHWLIFQKIVFQQDYRLMQFNSTLLFPFEEHIIDINHFPWRYICFCSLFLACVFIVKSIITIFFRRIKMWVFSITLPNLSLISSLTREIYYQTGISLETQTDIKTYTQTESDTLPI